MLEGKAIIVETDMLQTMQQDALVLASKALDVFDVTEATEIGRFIKKEFDKTYGPGWQCIVGTDFGSFVTHCHGCFIYFCLGNLQFCSSGELQVQKLRQSSPGQPWRQ
ncbi:dynein light chain 2 cytoplasmic [Prunus yedoensis var. nudiflora]|uniref:Dynein light chain n=1 Tax=Prunus yedoensis var. nudiflora TaxID=2094558 RepID=A0A314ZD37_PRUYE|nr:dynein light chain 2 cytoplasmic [Prunus yedoensis var. nudiflora]